MSHPISRNSDARSSRRRSKRPPTTAGSARAAEMSRAKAGGTSVSACTKTSASPWAAQAPAFIWPARPRGATSSTVHRGRASSRLRSVLAPSTTITSAPGAPTAIASSVRAIVRSSLSIGTITESFFTLSLCHFFLFLWRGYTGGRGGGSMRTFRPWRMRRPGIHQRERFVAGGEIRDTHGAAFDSESTLPKELDRPGKDAMLLCSDPYAQNVLVVAGHDWHHRLHDNRSVVDALTHEKHGASGKEDTVLERRLLRMHARKDRQQ